MYFHNRTWLKLLINSDMSNSNLLENDNIQLSKFTHYSYSARQAMDQGRWKFASFIS